MRVWLVVLALSTVADADPARWQESPNAPPITRVWGVGSDLYGVGPQGAHRSTDGGATWSPAERTAANGVWGTALDDVWVIRDRSIAHSIDGEGGAWTSQSLPVSMTTRLEGMWGIGDERYVFGGDRSSRTAVLLHSRDRGRSWRSETVSGESVAGIWGRAANDVYAVGARGVMHSIGDGAWTAVRSPALLSAIAGDAKTIYVVGAAGTIASSTDGKTWTRRASGVSYALSSIVIGNGELFAGSLDGPPLRSTDGASWKPLTAMVPKGNVWVADGQLVAAASTVQFFGDGLPGEPIRDPIPPELRALFAHHAPYRSTIQLLEHAAHALDPMFRAPALPPGVARVRILSITNCSRALDAIGDRVRGRGVEVLVTLKCRRPCSETPVPSVTQITTISRHGSGEPTPGRERPNAQLCTATDPRDAVTLDELETSLSEERTRSIRVDSTPDGVLAANARYVLDGGLNPKPRFEIARALSKSMDWPGFFWSPSYSTARGAISTTGR